MFCEYCIHQFYVCVFGYMFFINSYILYKYLLTIKHNYKYHQSNIFKTAFKFYIFLTLFPFPSNEVPP